MIHVFLTSELPRQSNDAITFFKLHAFVLLGTRKFFQKSLKVAYTSLSCLDQAFFLLFCFVVFFVEFFRVLSYGLRVSPVHVSKSPLIFLDVLVNFVFRLSLGSMCCCEQCCKETKRNAGRLYMYMVLAVTSSIVNLRCILRFSSKTTSTGSTIMIFLFCFVLFFFMKGYT